MASITDPEIIDFPGAVTAVVRREELPVDEMAAFMDSAFQALGAAIGTGAVVPTGAAFARYDTEFGETVTLEVGFPVVVPLDAPIEGDGVTVRPSTLPAGPLATTACTGAYEGLAEAWADFAGRVAALGYGLGMPCWERYDTEPGPDVDPAALVTTLAVPVTRTVDA